MSHKLLNMSENIIKNITQLYNVFDHGTEAAVTVFVFLRLRRWTAFFGFIRLRVSAAALLLFTGWSAEAACSHLDCAQAPVSANASVCAQHFGLWTYPGTDADLVWNSIASMQENIISDILLWVRLHTASGSQCIALTRCVCSCARVDIQGNCHGSFQHKPDVCVCVCA